MDWAQKRKVTYLLWFAGIIAILSVFPVYSLISKPATCFDARKNGTETGVDCGGSCNLMCAADVKAPRAIWAKAFPINGSYDLGVFVENMNTTAGIRNVRYTIRAIGSTGEVLAEKTGSVEFVPSGRVLLFETGVHLAVPPKSVEVLFNNEDLSKWVKASAAPSTVVTKNQSLINADTKPRFNAVLVNTDRINDVTNLTLGAIVYDSLKRPIAISKTYVERIEKGGEQNIFFTWPSHFTLKARGEMCIAPVSTMFVVDRSKNMNVGTTTPAEPFESIKNSIKSYLGVLGENDKVGLVTFDGTASSTVNIELTPPSPLVIDAFSSVALSKDASLNIDLGRAIQFASDELVRNVENARKKSIIVFTDGYTTRPTSPLNPKDKKYAETFAIEASNKARTDGTVISVFGVGKKVNHDFLRQNISSGTSNYFSTSSPEILQELHRTTSEIACPQENFVTELIVTPRAIFAE